MKTSVLALSAALSIAALGCDSADDRVGTLALAGSYVFEIEEVGVFGGEASGLLRPANKTSGRRPT